MTNRRKHLLAAVAGLALASVFTAAAAQTAAIPRTPAGKPDLSGMWGRAGSAPGFSDKQFEFEAIFPSRRCAPTQPDCTPQTNQGIDGEFTARASANRPLYKPEFWDKVQFLDMNTNQEDPLFACQPYGVPRVGPPAKIIQSEKEIAFLYRAGIADTKPADYRVIPIDGRPHDPIRSLDVTFYGDSVGKWDGDVLVIDSVGFNDLTWLASGGYFSSDQKHTIERLWREGDTLVYQVTVDDPGVLVQPWVMDAQRVALDTSPEAYLAEGQPCKDYDRENMSSQIRH